MFVFYLVLGPISHHWVVFLGLEGEIVFVGDDGVVDGGLCCLLRGPFCGPVVDFDLLNSIVVSRPSIVVLLLAWFLDFVLGADEGFVLGCH